MFFLFDDIKDDSKENEDFNMNNIEDKYENERERERIKFVNKINGRFKMKYLTYGIEEKIWHEIFEKSDLYTKALMNARRSDKCLAFLNHYRGSDYDNKIFLDNQQWNLILRILFGLQLKNNNEFEVCNKCNHTIRSANY